MTPKELDRAAVLHVEVERTLKWRLVWVFGFFVTVLLAGTSIWRGLIGDSAGATAAYFGAIVVGWITNFRLKHYSRRSSAAMKELDALWGNEKAR